MIAHWVPANPMRDVLAVAYRPGTAAPVEIRLRPELLHRIGRQWIAYATRTRQLDVRVVEDDRLPKFPGFEVVRTPPQETAA